MVQAVSTAKQAIQKQDFDLLNASYDALTKNLDARSAELDKLYKVSQDAQQQAIDEKKAADDAAAKEYAIREDARDFAVKNNITKPYYQLGDSIVNTATGELMTPEQIANGKPLDQVDWDSLIDTTVGTEKPATAKANDFQYVPATAHQAAGYFNKATGEFKPINGATIATPTKTGTATPKTSSSGISSPVTTSATGITAGSKEFQIAQDLAYGTLTFAGFKALYSYSRDVNAKTDIYMKARELNPNFDPAQFELGYKVASNPKMRQQVASMDNVLARANDLVSMSDNATRTGITSLNKIVEKGGIISGNTKYSNFHTAQVAFADELSGALGFGSATDMSRQMGFNMTDESLTPEQFSSAMNNVVVPFINSKRDTLINQMGIYGTDVNQMSSGNNSATGTTGGTTYKGYTLPY